MKPRTKYRRQHLVLTIEYLTGGSEWPLREALPVRGMKHARSEMVRFAFFKDVKPCRVWVSKYQFGNTTEREREIPYAMWQGVSLNMGMPGWCYREIYLIGKDKP